jgi:hypothetical protein
MRKKKAIGFITMTLVLLCLGGQVFAGCPSVEQDEELPKTIQTMLARSLTLVIDEKSYYLPIHKYGEPYMEIFHGAEELSRYQYLFAQALEDYGLIELTGDEHFGSELLDKFNYLNTARPMSGNFGKITVVATEKSKELSKRYEREFNGSTIKLKIYTGSTGEIVDKQTLVIGSSTYAVIRVRITRDITDEAAQVYGHLKNLLSGLSNLPSCLNANLSDTKRKAVFLLQRDDFECKWRIVSNDSSYSSDGELCSNNVDAVIKARQ